MTTAVAHPAETAALDPLTAAERLAEFEATIERGLATFLEVGEALLEIRRLELWRASPHRTWREYVRERWGLSWSRADQLTTTAKVARAITEQTGQPPREASAHALRQLGPVLRSQGPEAAAQTFEKVRAEHGEKPSAAKVRQAVADAGVTPYAGQGARRTSLTLIGDALLTARRRVDRLEGEMAGKPLGAQARERARRLANDARGLAAALDELGGVAAPQGRPLDGPRCACRRGGRNDGHGVCASCGLELPWRPNGSAHGLAAA